MRDRYLFSADRKASEYRSLLEITPGHARLLTPPPSARRVRWLASIGLGVLYYFVATWIWIPAIVVLSANGAPSWAGPAVLVGAMVVWFVGLFLLFWWWDQRSLPLLLADGAPGIELTLLGVRSFGTFQDVRARTTVGEELHLVVDTRAPRFWEAVRLLGGNPAPSL